MTTAAMPRTIRASIHPDALSRVPDFFNASTLQILNELLQNSRRAGATKVDIVTTRHTISVADDGDGIHDPAALLAFGLSGWDESTARSEHPAGMGVYSLARRSSSRISSRTRGSSAWTVELTPGVFLGDRPAEVAQDAEFPQEHGTTVSFARNTDEYNPANTIRQAAQHFPLPVTLNGEPLEQAEFLEGALRVETWEGVRIGVFDQGQSKGMNFHGTIIKHPDLPNTPTRHGNWYVQADVDNAPELQLVLPTRHQIVQTVFLERLKDACRAVTYRAMRDHHEPLEVPFKVHRMAAEEGIDLPTPTAVLPQWKAATARPSWSRQEYQPVPEDAIIVANTLSVADQQVLERAARLAGQEGRLFRPESGMLGYHWYDRIQRMDDLRILYTVQGQCHDLDSLRKQIEDMTSPPEEYPERPEHITVNLRASHPRRGSISLGLPTDVAFANDYEEYMDENLPMVAQDSAISPKELTELLVDAFWTPSEDKGSDSFDTQEERHREASSNIAHRLLTSQEEATMARIQNAVQRELLFMIPVNSVLTISTAKGQPVRIELSPVPPEATS